MADELLELARLRANLPPADEAKMARARATLVHTATSVPARRRRFPVRIAATATVGAAAVTALLLVPSAGDQAPTASAVTLNDDGTVTIVMNDLVDRAEANQVLKDAGIRAELVGPQPPGTCEPGTELGDPLASPDDLMVREEPFRDITVAADPPGFVSGLVTFRPDRIPADTTLVLLTGPHSPGRVGFLVDANDENMSKMMTAELHPSGAGTCFDRIDMINR